MAPRRFAVISKDVVWGQLPSGEIHEYTSIQEYFDAYRAEENEIIDEMARLEEEQFVELPEDYACGG